MTTGSSIFRRFLARFRQKDTPVPLEEQPLPIEPIIPDFMDDFAEEWFEARYSRIGNETILHYKNADRLIQFVGRDEPMTFVKQGQFLSGTVLVITPDGLAYEFTVSFKSGEQFSYKKFERLLSGAIRKKNPEFPPGYTLIRESEVTSIWYLNTYEVRAPL